MKIQPIPKKVALGILASSIVTGILFCCLGVKFFNVLLTIVGALIVLGGLFSVVSKRYVLGIVLVAVGAFIIVAAWQWPRVPSIVFGVLMIMSGIAGFIGSVQNEDVGHCISSVLSAVLGGFLIGYREGADWMIFVIGALFIVTGIIGIILVCVKSKKGVKTVDVKDVK